MVFNVHREKTDELQMIPLLNEFIGHYESRIDLKSHNLVSNLYYDIFSKIRGGLPPPSPSVYRHTGMHWSERITS